MREHHFIRLAFALPKGGQFNELFDFALKKIIETVEMGKLRIKWASPGKYLDNLV